MHSPVKLFPALWFVATLSITTSAESAQYAVEGFLLGSRITDKPNYQTYSCRPSSDFKGVTDCEKTQIRETGATFSSNIRHTEAGTAVYLTVNVAPVQMNPNTILREIEGLSREIGERPVATTWSPQRPGRPMTLIAYWGKVKLQELGWEAVRAVTQGQNVELGALVDTIGDKKSSSLRGLPIYRVTGGAGYLYIASFDESGRGHRNYVAVDASPLMEKQAEASLLSLLQLDRSRADGDYSLWPQVATIARKLALDTSQRKANDLLDKAFTDVGSRKLRSQIWSLLPLGVIEHLGKRQHWSVDIYLSNTAHRDIRAAILKFVAERPKAPFVEFLLYTVGEYDKAIQANPNSIISDVLYYASAYKIIASLLQDTMTTIRERVAPNSEPFVRVDWALRFLNSNPKLYERESLSSLVPSFAERAAAARPYLEAVLRDRSAPHADDAAYWLGWLALHQGKTQEALQYFSEATVVGNKDYRHPGLRRSVRILEPLPPREQLTIVQSNQNFSQQSPLWYLAIRAAYRDYDYTSTIEFAERALRALSVPVDRFPATTDQNVIRSTLERVNQKLSWDYDLREILYLYQASKESLHYETSLSSLNAERPENFFRRSQAIITKFSMLRDEPETTASSQSSTKLAHKDLRQALQLIKMTLARTPIAGQHGRLREWLHYRKVRILVQYDPAMVSDAVAAFEREFPRSSLLDDALAEQLLAEGIMRDLSAATNTFRKLINTFPNGNAIDNAHSWMAIILRCMGRVEEAQGVNWEIIRRFPSSRHARYARERMSNPSAEACGLARPRMAKG